jgi:hypothetical protein
VSCSAGTVVQFGYSIPYWNDPLQNVGFILLYLKLLYPILFSRMWIPFPAGLCECSALRMPNSTFGMIFNMLKIYTALLYSTVKWISLVRWLVCRICFSVWIPIFILKITIVYSVQLQRIYIFSFGATLLTLLSLSKGPVPLPTVV